jgi:hypothetical protein
MAGPTGFEPRFIFILSSLFSLKNELFQARQEKFGNDVALGTETGDKISEPCTDFHFIWLFVGVW